MKGPVHTENTVVKGLTSKTILNISNLYDHGEHRIALDTLQTVSTVLMANTVS